MSFIFSGTPCITTCVFKMTCILRGLIDLDLEILAAENIFVPLSWRFVITVTRSKLLNAFSRV